jgi:hypothetical protein
MVRFLITERAVSRRSGELVFLPHLGHSWTAAGPSRLGGELPFLNGLVAAALRRFRTFALNDTTIT